MKNLVVKLTEDNLVIKNYIIIASSEKYHTHTIFGLTNEFCEELAEKHDKGLAYSVHNRYFYTCNLRSATKLGFPFLTAKAVVQRVIWDHFGDITYLKIIKFQDNEKDNSISEKVVDQI